MTVEFALSSRKFPGLMGLVDDEDWLKIQGHRWSPDGRYVASRVGGVKVRLHRVVLADEIDTGFVVDHLNGDGRDNRRCNLRVVTQAQNARNLCGQAGASSPLRGVGWIERLGKWRAQATYEGRNHYLGVYAAEDDAARAVEEFWLARGGIIRGMAA